MKAKRIYFGGVKTLLMALAFTLAGCDDWKELYADCPPTVGETECSEGGRLTLITQWDPRSPEAAIPNQYMAFVGTYWDKLVTLSNVLDHEFNPGNHHVNVFNMPEKVTITGLTATVAATESGIDALPGFLFTYSGNVIDLKENESRDVIAPMIQQVGTVTYEIRMGNGSDVGDYIASVAATLDGVASQIDMETGALSAPSSIEPSFTLEGGKYLATSRILGPLGASQMLTLDLGLANGAGTQTLSQDVASTLADFNANKLDSYHILVVITDVNELTGMITGWEIGGERTGTID